MRVRIISVVIPIKCDIVGCRRRMHLPRTIVRRLRGHVECPDWSGRFLSSYGCDSYAPKPLEESDFDSCESRGRRGEGPSGHPEPAKRRPWQRQRRESLDGSDGRFCRFGHWSSELRSTFSSRHNRVIIHVRGVPLCGGRGRLMRSSVCLTHVRGRVVGAAPLISASAATVAASRETATARPTVLGNFMGAPLLPARHGDSPQRLQSLAEATACARPAQQTQRSDAADEIRNYLWTCIR